MHPLAKRADLACLAEEVRARYVVQTDDAQYHSHRAAAQSPQAKTLVMRGHVSGGQRQAVADQCGNDGVRIAEKDFYQVARRAVGSRVKQDDEQYAQTEVNG